MAENQYKVAVLLVGMTRKFRKGSESWFKNLINLYPNVQFDFFLYTWNVFGDYKYNDKDFGASLENNWVSHDDLPDQDIENLKRIYSPKFLKIESYSDWEKSIQERFDSFINKHNCHDEPLRIFNGIFAQYYQVMKGFTALEEWAVENSVDLTQDYDMIIRSRYDLEILEPADLNWELLIARSKTHILGLEQWDRNGMRGNWIAGSYPNMKKYANFYNCLDVFSVEQLKEAKLPSIIVPKFIFNYIFADGRDPGEMSDPEIFAIVKDPFYKQMNRFLSVPSRFTFRISLIPEIFLRWYVEKYLGIPVYLEEFLENKVVDGQKSHAI